MTGSDETPTRAASAIDSWAPSRTTEHCRTKRARPLQAGREARARLDGDRDHRADDGAGNRAADQRHVLPHDRRHRRDGQRERETGGDGARPAAERRGAGRARTVVGGRGPRAPRGRGEPGAAGAARSVAGDDAGQSWPFQGRQDADLREGSRPCRGTSYPCNSGLTGEPGNAVTMSETVHDLGALRALREVGRQGSIAAAARGARRLAAGAVRPDADPGAGDGHHRCSPARRPGRTSPSRAGSSSAGPRTCSTPPTGSRRGCGPSGPGCRTGWPSPPARPSPSTWCRTGWSSCAASSRRRAAPGRPGRQAARRAPGRRAGTGVPADRRRAHRRQLHRGHRAGQGRARSGSASSRPRTCPPTW